jgi:hypothetical protein
MPSKACAEREWGSDAVDQYDYIVVGQARQGSAGIARAGRVGCYSSRLGALPYSAADDFGLLIDNRANWRYRSIE